MARWKDRGRGSDDERATNRTQEAMTAERRAGIKADIIVQAPIGLANQVFLLDPTVSGIHCESNRPQAFKKLDDDSYDLNQGGVADKAEDAKNKLYAKYDHVEFGIDSEGRKVEKTKHIVPFAFDARGGIGNDALTFISKVYGKQTIDGPVRQWQSDSMRTNLRNQLMDKLSCLLARHRALDYMFIGVPSAYSESGFEPSPTIDIVNKKRKNNKRESESKNKEKADNVISTTDSTRVDSNVSIDQGIEESKKNDEDMGIDIDVQQFLERTRIDLARSSNTEVVRCSSVDNAN